MENERKSGTLIHFGVFSGLAPGSSTNYTIDANGTIRLTISYGFSSLKGPVTMTIEDHLTPEELALFQEFVDKEVVGHDYESETIMDYTQTIQAGGKTISNCDELNEKFLSILNRVVEKHRAFSNDSINPMYEQISLQFQEGNEASVLDGMDVRAAEEYDDPLEAMKAELASMRSQNNNVQPSEYVR